MKTFLKIDAISKDYRGKKANDNISFEIFQGDIVGLIGENGAGKTTLLKMILGHIKPTSGEVVYSEEIRMGGLIENPGILPYLTADENLKSKQISMGKVDRSERKYLLDKVGLNENKKKVKTFSLGMKQRLGIAMAAIGNSNFLILDEPVNGLDPSGIIEIRKLFKEMNENEGKTMLISSHILDELSKVANRFVFIKNGKITYECKKDSLPEGKSLEDLYMEFVGGMVNE